VTPQCKLNPHIVRIMESELEKTKPIATSPSHFSTGSEMG